MAVQGYQDPFWSFLGFWHVCRTSYMNIQSWSQKCGLTSQTSLRLCWHMWSAQLKVVWDAFPSHFEGSGYLDTSIQMNIPQGWHGLLQSLIWRIRGTKFDRNLGIILQMSCLLTHFEDHKTECIKGAEPLHHAPYLLSLTQAHAAQNAVGVKKEDGLCSYVWITRVKTHGGEKQFFLLRLDDFGPVPNSSTIWTSSQGTI